MYYKEDYWGGVSYRHLDAVIIMAGMKYRKMYFGVSYDYTLSKLRQFSYGSTEIVIGYNLFEGAGAGSSIL